MKEFSGSDNAELFVEDAERQRLALLQADAARRAAVPGLVPVMQRADEGGDL